MARRILLLCALSGLAAGAWFWHALDDAVTDLSPAGLVNKSAVFFGVKQPHERLIQPPTRYTDLAVAPPSAIAHPRVLLPSLRAWDGLQRPPAIQARLDWMAQNKERFRLQCDSRNPLQRALCFFRDPTQANRHGLEAALQGFKLDPPYIDGRYGNAWILALAVDLAGAIPQFDPAALAQGQAQLRAALTKHLALLDGNSASLWHGRSTLASTAFLLATAMDSQDQPDRALYARAYGHFADLLQGIEATEAWPEGYNYWLQSRGLVIALALAAYKQTSAPEQAKRAMNLSYRIGLWHIFLTRPDNRMEGWGDEGSRVDLKEGTRRIIDILASTAESDQLRRYSLFLKHLSPRSSYYHGRLWQPLLFHSPQWESTLEQPITSLEDVMGRGPAAELFGAGFSNYLVIRSGWGADDTFITFRASDIFAHHQHYDAGHFTLFKRKPLIVNASTYNGMFAPHRLNFAIRTIAKNSLLIRDPAEQVRPNRFFEQNIVDGGQRIVLPTGSAINSFEHWRENRYQGAHFGTSELLAYQTLDGIATYIQVDITRAYNSIRFAPGSSAKVKRVVRSLLYLYRQDALVIRDEVLTAKSELPVDWILHTYTPFALPQSTLLNGTRDNGITSGRASAGPIQTLRGDLSLEILAPKAPRATQIGGPDYRYFVPNPGDLSSGTNYDQGSSSEPWFEQPDWRLHIHGQPNNNTHRFTVVIRPGGAQHPAVSPQGMDPSTDILDDDIRVRFSDDCGAIAKSAAVAAATLRVQMGECSTQRVDRPVLQFIE